MSPRFTKTGTDWLAAGLLAGAFLALGGHSNPRFGVAFTFLALTAFVVGARQHLREP